MTVVHVDLRNADGTPAQGSIDFEPTLRREVDDHVLLPSPIREGLVDGVVDVDLAPTTSQWVWRVEEHVAYGSIRYVAVPDDPGTVNYTDLVDVDPATLDPTTELDPVWQAELEALEARVAALEARPANEEMIFIWDGASYNVPAEQPTGVIVRHFYGPNPYIGSAWSGVLDVYEFVEV